MSDDYEYDDQHWIQVSNGQDVINTTLTQVSTETRQIIHSV